MADYVVLAEQDSVVVRVSANYVAATLAEIGETYKWMKNFPHMKNEPWAYAAFDLAIAGEQAIKIIKDLPSDDTLKSEADIELMELGLTALRSRQAIIRSRGLSSQAIIESRGLKPEKKFTFALEVIVGQV